MNAHEARKQVTWLLADFGDRLRANCNRKNQRLNKLCEQFKQPRPATPEELDVMSDALLAQGGVAVFETLADKLLTLIKTWEDAK